MRYTTINMQFDEAKAIGDIAEDEFVEFLHTHGWDGAKMHECGRIPLVERRFWDVWGQKAVPSKAVPVEERPILTFEVKYDKRVKETGNVYLEHEGLRLSRADIIVYKLDSDGQFYIQRYDKVMQYIKATGFKKILGGNEKTPGTLIPEAIFKKLFVNAEKEFATQEAG